MLARWPSFLETYDFEIKYRKGSLHGNADGLSRRPSRRCKIIDCKQCYGTLPNSKDKSSEESDRQNSACTENNQTVSAVTNKENQKNENYQTFLCSNWLGTDVDIERLQSEDGTIKTIRDFLLTSKERPTLATSDKELDVLLKQWSVL